MATKICIKDVARVMDLPLQDSNALAKLVPEKPGIELKRVLTAPLSGDNSLEDKEGLTKEDLEEVKKLRAIYAGSDLQASVLKEALILEGSVRGTGVHAAGIIIAPKDLTDIIPVATSRDSDLLVTQFDGKVIEDSGVIKMDFLGLKTLTILRDALRLIEQNHGVKIDIDAIPLDDAKTFELYQRGDTNGTFQFESAGMQKHLRDLKPDKFADLIAMNALYRPGPIEYIPNFISRKHGREAVAYDLEEMKEYLEDTYGITVYQEQVMLLSQKLANFTKGDADVLRKAMGKKDKKTLDKLKPQFVENAKKNGHDEKIIEKIWTDWEKFAQYAFNKSHSTCYAFVAFQTAYLKAHYAAEYMASVLTHNLSNIDKITFFMDECKRMGVPVLGPDVNESTYQFSVNKSGQIRFGMGAVKGVGEAAVQAIVDERTANGPFKSIFDLVRRINLRAANKKTFESLAYAGGFDSFGINRATYFKAEGNDNVTFLEKAVRYGNAQQDGANSSQVSLFGEESAVEMPEPNIPAAEAWGNIEQLKYEKDVVGFYISGHPLDSYKLELDEFCANRIPDLKDLKKVNGKELTFGGIVTSAREGITKTGKPYGVMMIEDYYDSFEMALFGEDYVKFKLFMTPGYFLYIKGKVQSRFNQADNLELKVSNIQLLSELRDKLARTITVTVPLKTVSDDFISLFSNIVSENEKTQPKNCLLRFRVIDFEENVVLDLPSKKLKVNPNNEFLQLLKENKLEYKLN